MHDYQGTWATPYASTWEVIVQAAEDQAPNSNSEGNIVTTQPYTVNELPVGEYMYWVRSVCNGGLTGQWSSRAFTVDCASPTNISMEDNVISWTSIGNESQWEVLVIPAGTTVSPGTVGVITSSNPYVAPGLIPGQNYDVYVRSICSGVVLPSSWSLPRMMQYTPLGINDYVNTTVKMWPNPAKHNVMLQLQNSGASFETINFYDLAGKQIYSFAVSNAEVSLDLGNIQTGLYVVEIFTSDSEKIVEKLLIN